MHENTRSTQGFTLLELLVVLMILAVISSVVVLSFTDFGRDRSLLAAAERLALVIELARTEVSTRNEIWVLHVGRDHYYFEKQAESSNAWVQLKVRPFHPIRIDEDLEFVNHLRASDTERRTAGESPMLVLYPSGEISPLRLEVRVRFGNANVFLVSDGFQKVGFADHLEP